MTPPKPLVTTIGAGEINRFSLSQDMTIALAPQPIFEIPHLPLEAINPPP
jgi:hypothetical protein